MIDLKFEFSIQYFWLTFYIQLFQYLVSMVLRVNLGDYLLDTAVLSDNEGGTDNPLSLIHIS